MRGTNTPSKGPVGGLYDKKRVGRRIRNARQDRNQTVDELATLVVDLTGEPMTPQMVKNIEAGRKRVAAELLPIFAFVQRKSFAYYLLDDPTRYDLREAGLGRGLAPVIDIRAMRPMSVITKAA